MNSAAGLSRPPTRGTSPSTSVSHHNRHNGEAASHTPTVVPKREDPLDGLSYTMPLENDSSPIQQTADIPRGTPRRDSTDSVGLQNMMGGLDIERRASADSTFSVEGNKRREGEPSGDDRPLKRMRMSIGSEEVDEERMEKEIEEGEVGEGNVVKEELVDQSFAHQRETSTTSDGTPPSPNIRRRGIGIHHMDLLYETKGNSMVCRICV